MTLRHDSRVILSRADFERHSAIVASRQAAETWPALAEELSRAEVVEPGDRPGTAVAMDSRVEFVDEATGRARRVVLVYPGREDIETGRISILTPVGTALIGLCVGDTAEWQTRGGAWKRLRIVRVEPVARPDETGAPGAG